MKTARTFGILIAVILGARTLLAQSPDCLHRTVTVNVLDSRKQIVTGIRPEDLSGSFRHKPVKIDFVAPVTSPPRVFIVLDASSSMTALRLVWNSYIEASNRLVDSVPAGTLVGLIVFATEIDKTIPLGNGTAEVKEELEKLRVGNESFLKGRRTTALWDALNDAISQMDPAREGDAIYVLTDGVDTASKISTKTVKEAFLATGIRLFVYSVDNSAEPLPELDLRYLDFQELAPLSGGFAVSVPSIAPYVPKPLSDKSGKRTDAGEMLLAQLRQIFYYQRVEIVLPEPPDKPEKWSLNAKGSKFHDPVVVYPRMLDTCTQPKTVVSAAH
ncbi:MAG: VWA domain-containing protein [Candidatus Acidiferrales bacterium]